MSKKKFIQGCMHEFMINSLKNKSLSKALYPSLSIDEARYVCSCVYDNIKSKKNSRNLEKFIQNCSLQFKPKRRKSHRKSRSRRKSRRRSRSRRKSRRRSRSRRKFNLANNFPRTAKDMNKLTKDEKKIFADKLEALLKHNKVIYGKENLTIYLKI